MIASLLGGAKGFTPSTEIEDLTNLIASMVDVIILLNTSSLGIIGAALGAGITSAAETTAKL
jgi:hypothetical protein